MRECRRRQSLRQVGRQKAPHRSRMGTSRPRRKGGSNVHLGRRIKTERQMDGELFSGKVSGPKHRPGRLPIHGPSWLLPPTNTDFTTWRERLGNLQRLLSPCLLQTVSSRTSPESNGPRISDHADRTGGISSNRHLPAATSGGSANSVPSRHQRRILSLPFRLLPALSTGGPSPFGIAGPEQPRRFSLRQGCRPRGLKALIHSF